MIADTLLASGLLLSTASQLRLAGFAIGPAEICLVIWLVSMLGREAGRFGPPMTPALSRLLIFWALFTLAQSLGTLTGLAIGDVHDPDLFWHDVMAYPILAAVSCMSVVDPGAGPRLRRVAWLLAGPGTVFLALQLADGWGLIDIPLIDPWYWNRLRGFSENPNQLALICTVLGFLSLHLAETAARLPARIAALACAILPIYVGRLTRSDSFALVLLTGGPIFVALKFRTWLLSFERGMTFRFAFAWIVILALPLILASVAPLGSSIAARAQGIAMGMSKDSGKDAVREAELRFGLWREAISRGLEAGMLGLGPGPHLEIPPSIVAARLGEKEPKYVEHPALNSMPNYEAHNTLLDLFTQGGLVAVLSFLWIAATALLITYRARLDALTTLVCGVGVFSMFHLIVRHPIFWFVIALCLVAGAEAGRSSAVREGS